MKKGLSIPSIVIQVKGSNNCISFTTKISYNYFGEHCILSFIIILRELTKL